MTKTEAYGILKHWQAKLENGESLFISHHDKSFQEAMKIAILEMEAVMYENKEVILNDNYSKT